MSQPEYADLLGIGSGYLAQVVTGAKPGSLNLLEKALIKAGIDPEECIVLPQAQLERTDFLARAAVILRRQDKWDERLRHTIEDIERRVAEEQVKRGSPKGLPIDTSVFRKGGVS